MNDWNVFVCEDGRGKCVLARSLDIAEVLRGVGEGDGDRKPVCTYFGKKTIVNVYLVCLLMRLSWQQIIC